MGFPRCEPSTMRAFLWHANYSASIDNIPDPEVSDNGGGCIKVVIKP